MRKCGRRIEVERERETGGERGRGMDEDRGGIEGGLERKGEREGVHKYDNNDSGEDSPSFLESARRKIMQNAVT